jgi:hypothetical protein
VRLALAAAFFVAKTKDEFHDRMNNIKDKQAEERITLPRSTPRVIVDCLADPELVDAPSDEFEVEVQDADAQSIHSQQQQRQQHHQPQQETSGRLVRFNWSQRYRRGHNSVDRIMCIFTEKATHALFLYFWSLSVCV